VGAGIVFGLALSVASTVVLLRALQDRHLVDSDRGHIAVGWLVVEDLAMVLTLVLLPAIAGVLGAAGVPPARAPFSILGIPDIVISLAVTLGKLAAFVAVMLVVGRRFIPWLLHRIVHTGSRELFRLAVLAISLGVAYGCAMLFDVSFALGAFFAGMILSESELSQQAAEETLPLRDAFAVLFFVSVGMLFDPGILVRDPWPVLAAVAIVMVGKSIAAFIIVLAFRRPMTTALTISASLAQIGEFSFILAGLGLALKLLPEAGRDLILAAAILSIMANPALFALVDRYVRKQSAATVAGAALETPTLPPTRLAGHAVVVAMDASAGRSAKD
jgi:CPA2 family monovalent cation:H+ antiporter-2